MWVPISGPNTTPIKGCSMKWSSWTGPRRKTRSSRIWLAACARKPGHRSRLTPLDLVSTDSEHGWAEPASPATGPGHLGNGGWLEGKGGVVGQSGFVAFVTLMSVVFVAAVRG